MYDEEVPKIEARVSMMVLRAPQQEASVLYIAYKGHCSGERHIAPYEPYLTELVVSGSAEVVHVVRHS